MPQRRKVSAWVDGQAKEESDPTAGPQQSPDDLRARGEDLSPPSDFCRFSGQSPGGGQYVPAGVDRGYTAAPEAFGHQVSSPLAREREQVYQRVGGFHQPDGNAALASAQGQEGPTGPVNGRAGRNRRIGNGPSHFVLQGTVTLCEGEGCRLCELGTFMTSHVVDQATSAIYTGVSRAEENHEQSAVLMNRMLLLHQDNLRAIHSFGFAQ